MQDDEFRRWLSARRWNGKPLTSVSSRMSKARRFEKAMPALGLGEADLDAAFEADGMERVTQALRDWCRSAAETGQAPAELVGTTTNAPMRINNVAAAVRNYRQFREGATTADGWPALDEDDVFVHFDDNAAFADARAGWSEDATAAFRAVAQAAHDAGLDWWFVNKPPYELRCGRKDAGRRKARAVLVYIGEPGPWLGVNEKEGPRYVASLGLTDAPWAALTPDLAARFAALVEEHEDFGDYWRFGAPAREGLWPDESQTEIPAPDMTGPAPVMAGDPTNLILYGPPGTGKTFATAEHAVRLCGEPVPADRAELMARYRMLGDAGRIEFVTFHQSMAYEDFVEGLRPEPNADGAGFTLEPRPGIFRRIARRAETSTGPGDATFAIGDRQIFKMSIGEVANPDDAALFDDAIAGGYTVLGFADIDWSDARYADRRAIVDAIHEHDGNTDADASSGRVQMPHIFRNWMKPNDLVIVSKGNGLFRAIGEITGDYRFMPRDGGGYAHRRAVRWLWIDREGVPVGEIYARGFSMRSVYQLTHADLNLPALERYVVSQQNVGTGAPEPFVLVIDEINRANISKVFGELITLLEPDKRLGRPNELRVRLPHSQESFGVPANLHIIGTMNTADRSIALIDKALRRRFTFEEMMPDYEVEGLDLMIDGVTLAHVLATINDRIEYLLDREHQIGHGWVMHCTTRAQLDAVMRTKVIPLIAEYFFEDWGRTADVLGGRDGNPFLDKVALTPPPGLVAEEPRYRWSIAADFAPGAYARLVAGR